MRYGAFLSYSHADDRHARWRLQRLEGYRVPKWLIGTPGRYGRVPARLGPAFRDRDELPTAGDLGSTIADDAARGDLVYPRQDRDQRNSEHNRSQQVVVRSTGKVTRQNRMP